MHQGLESRATYTASRASVTITTATSIVMQSEQPRPIVQGRKAGGYVNATLMKNGTTPSTIVLINREVVKATATPGCTLRRPYTCQ